MNIVCKLVVCRLNVPEDWTQLACLQWAWCTGLMAQPGAFVNLEFLKVTQCLLPLPLFCGQAICLLPVLFLSVPVCFLSLKETLLFMHDFIDFWTSLKCELVAMAMVFLNILPTKFGAKMKVAQTKTCLSVCWMFKFQVNKNSNEDNVNFLHLQEISLHWWRCTFQTQCLTLVENSTSMVSRFLWQQTKA